MKCKIACCPVKMPNSHTAKFCGDHQYQLQVIVDEISKLTILQNALITARQCEPRFGDMPGYNIEIDKLADQIHMYKYALRIFNE